MVKLAGRPWAYPNFAVSAVAVPCPIRLLTVGQGEVVVSVACGWRHTAALSAQSHLFTRGSVFTVAVHSGRVVPLLATLARGDARPRARAPLRTSEERLSYSDPTGSVWWLPPAWPKIAPLAPSTPRWGHGGAGQLGHGGNIHFFLPLRLQPLASASSSSGATAFSAGVASTPASSPPTTWLQVSCGARHTAALG